MTARFVPINEKNRRIGESHGRAKFSDHDVELIFSLLDARNDAIETGLAAGMSPSVLNAHLNALQLSYRWIAIKMECNKTYVKKLADSTRRCQTAVRWKKVPVAGET